MFDFGKANREQIKAISTTDGPVLITAGPGTGKTYTLVQRAIYLIEERGVKPESIFIATFTEKAAKELITRITDELTAHDIRANLNEMYIGTFHSLCLRILKEHIEHTRLRRNYRVMDAFDQQYMVFQNINKFREIENFDSLLREDGSWRQSLSICGYVNNLSEELVEPDELMRDSDERIAVLGRILKLYREILVEENLIDFSSIQVEAYRLLRNDPAVLKELHSKITHIMIDEYQDTNYIQEQIVFLLGETHRNICVVGDDDQGLYRFRGATIRNILEFPQKFTRGKCSIIPLVVNYRSDSDIVDFYNRWMADTEGEKFKFHWKNFRYDKKIRPHKQSRLKSPAVAKLTSDGDEEKWHEKILNFINELKESGKLTDYNQIAFLFNSVKNPRVTALAGFLEENNINVYSPRSEMFFQRSEIRLALGFLMLLFPNYVNGLNNDEYTLLKEDHIRYYKDCIAEAEEYLDKPEGSWLNKWIQRTGKEHTKLNQKTNYGYSGLLYRLFGFEPFSGILGKDLNGGLVDVRPLRNLARLTQIIGKFEYLHRITVLDGEEYEGERMIDRNTAMLFNMYLRLLIDGGITEYEDDSEYAPSGCVSFMTIHQSKGMEFPIVFVDSLSNYPRKRSNELMEDIEEKYFKRPAFEPNKDIKYFDFWRLYYTAFSRAQDLLVLTCSEDKRTPSIYFRKPYEKLCSVYDPGFNINEFDFKTVRDVNIKNTYYFSTGIAAYETCARQYKFYNELEFMPKRAYARFFGMLVHETIEDIHRAALKHEEQSINKENICRWFDSNYESLTKTEHTYLAEPQKNAALDQVLKYADREGADWSGILQSELDVSLVRPDYILRGSIDVIRGEGDTVDIIDFKSSKKPDMMRDRDQIERYRRKLNICARLVQERTGQKVGRMHLYFTGEEGSEPTVTYPFNDSEVESAVAVCDDTVERILMKDFSGSADDARTCADCDFSFYCRNKQ